MCWADFQHVHGQGWPTARKVSFACFAVVFFVSRVALYPVTLLHFGWIQSREVLPAVTAELAAPYAVFNVLLMLLYIFQLYWMYGIIRWALALSLPQSAL